LKKFPIVDGGLKKDDMEENNDEFVEEDEMGVDEMRSH